MPTHKDHKNCDPKASKGGKPAPDSKKLSSQDRFKAMIAAKKAKTAGK